jgi:hypothetical protein
MVIIRDFDRVLVISGSGFDPQWGKPALVAQLVERSANNRKAASSSLVGSKSALEVYFGSTPTFGVV